MVHGVPAGSGRRTARRSTFRSGSGSDWHALAIEIVITITTVTNACTRRSYRGNAEFAQNTVQRGSMIDVPDSKQRIVMLAISCGWLAVAHAEPETRFTGEGGAYIGIVNLGHGPIGTFDTALGARLDDRVDLLFGMRAAVFNATGVDGWATLGTSLHVFVVPTIYVIAGVGLTLSASSHGGDSPLAGPAGGFEGTLGVGVRVIGSRRRGIDVRALGNLDTNIHSYPTLVFGSVGLAFVF
jgi:hypothetical protein